MYAIRNKITKQWLYGTDYREYPPRQRISNEQALTFETLEDVDHQFRKRKCGNEYESIEVELRAISDWAPRLKSPLDGLKWGDRIS